jgi:hypothetical protein
MKKGHYLALCGNAPFCRNKKEIKKYCRIKTMIREHYMSLYVLHTTTSIPQNMLHNSNTMQISPYQSFHKHHINARLLSQLKGGHMNLITQVAGEIFDDCEDRALIVVDEENRVLYSNQFALSLASSEG